MGRWAQRRRRGGSPSAAAAPATGPSLVGAFDIGGGQLFLDFDDTVVENLAGVPDLGAFMLDGNPVTVGTVSQPFPFRLQISQPLDPTAGMTVSWGSQPPWITTPINLASTAVVT